MQWLCCCWLLIIKSAVTRCFVFHYYFFTWYMMANDQPWIPQPLLTLNQAQPLKRPLNMCVRISDDGHTSVGRPHGSLVFPHWSCTFLQMSLHWCRCPSFLKFICFPLLLLDCPCFFFIGRLPLLVAMICDNGLEVGQRSQVGACLLVLSVN